MLSPVRLEELYLGLRQELHRFLLSRVRDASVADDLLHDVFLKIHERIDELRDPSRLESWVFRIASNAVHDHFRGRRSPGPEATSRTDPQDPPEVPGEGAAERLAPTLARFLEEMPEDYRQALVHTEIEGMSQVELARRLGLSPSGAKSRVQRARRWLRQRLLDCCHFELDRRGQVIDFRPNSCPRCCP